MTSPWLEDRLAAKQIHLTPLGETVTVVFGALAILASTLIMILVLTTLFTLLGGVRP